MPMRFWICETFHWNLCKIVPDKLIRQKRKLRLYFNFFTKPSRSLQKNLQIKGSSPRNWLRLHCWLGQKYYHRILQYLDSNLYRIWIPQRCTMLVYLWLHKTRIDLRQHMQSRWGLWYCKSRMYLQIRLWPQFINRIVWCLSSIFPINWTFVGLRLHH